MILLSFKDWAPSNKCITVIDGTTIYDTEDLDLIMTINNLIEYGSNFSQINESLLFYTKDEPTNFDADIANTNDF